MSAIRPSMTNPERLLKAVADGADDLISGRGWPDGVNTLLKSIGEATDVSRVWIFQTIEATEDTVTQDYVFEWAKDAPVAQIGMKCFSMFTNSLALPEYREVVMRRMQGKPYAVLPRSLPENWLRKTLWNDQRILSMLTFPIMVEGEWWGTLGFDDCEHECEWTDSETELLRTAASLLASAIIRQRLSVRLQQFSILKGLTESAAWSFDYTNRRAWYTSDLVNPRAEGIVSTDVDGLLDLINEEDRTRLQDSFRHTAANNERHFRTDVRLELNNSSKWVEIIGTVMRDEAGNPTQISGIAVDIRARKIQEARLLKQAETDALSGCYNRRAFEKPLRASMPSR